MKRSYSTALRGSSTSITLPLAPSPNKSPVRSLNFGLPAQQQHHPCDINSLPSDLLGYILQYLSLGDRVRIELVCKAWRELAPAKVWSDITHFNEDAVFKELFGQSPLGAELTTQQQTQWRSKLLLRVGSYLTSAAIRGGPTLRIGLERCPNLKHLGLKLEALKPRLSSFFRYKYGKQLKSLELWGCIHRTLEEWWLEKGNVNREALPLSGFNASLQHFASLEHLSVWEDKSANIRELMFTATMGKLRKLSFHARESSGQVGVATEFLTPEYVAMLALLPSLSSLTLDIAGTRVESLACLHSLVQLEHLCVKVLLLKPSFNADETPSLCLFNLKALDVEEEFAMDIHDTGALKYLLDGLADDLPHLEHLSLRTRSRLVGSVMEIDLLASVFPARMGKLRSLELQEIGRTRSPDGSWSWLAKMAKLEHLSLTWQPSVGTLYRVVNACKGLRYLDIGNHPLTWRACKKLVDGIRSDSPLLRVEIKEPESDTIVEAVAEEFTATRPTLLLRTSAANYKNFIACSDGTHNDEIKVEGLENSGSQTKSLMKIVKEAMPSHVRYHYSYGCLIEKKATELWTN